MARSLSLQPHSCPLQLTAVTQGTSSLEVQHAPARLMGHGQTLHPPVIVRIQYVLVFKITRTTTIQLNFLFAAVDCGNLTNPLNGQVTLTTTTFMSTATYSCNAGYNLSGNATRTCEASGTWSDTAPTCDRKYNMVQVTGAVN